MRKQEKKKIKDYAKAVHRGIIEDESEGIMMEKLKIGCPVDCFPTRGKEYQTAVAEG